MNWGEYHATTARELKGRRYRLAHPVRNGYAEIRAGTIVEVTGKRSGLDVVTDLCETCGVQVFCRKVEPGALGERVS